ncbi:MAG: nitrite reductase small subunit NirD [Pseudomonadota bacterium]
MLDQQWITICSVDDLIPNSGVCALHNSKQIAIFCIGEGTDNVKAIGNYDPKGKANVLYRGIIGTIGDELVVASPLYKDHYSLETGLCIEDDNLSVPVFDIKVVQNEVRLLV